MFRLRTMVGAAALALAAGTASAATIDFTGDAAYGPAFSNTGASGSFFSDGRTWTVTSDNPENALTRTKYDGPAGATGGLAETYDGLGVVDDEVTFTDPPELLHLGFSQATRVTGLHFLDLFFDERLQPEDQESVLVYFGGYDVGDTPDVEIFANEAFQTAGGYRFAEVDFFGTKISFAAGDGNDGVGRPDYALAAVEVVPLPAAGWMLLAGIGGLAAMKRRRKAA